MSKLIIDLEQGSPEWLAWRMGGVGGSDAPVIEGVSPYKTIRELHLEKCGTQIECEEDNEFIFAKGHRTESLIRREFSKLVNTDIKPICFQREDIPVLRVSLDGFHSEMGVLEGKLVGKDVIKTAVDRGEIPRHHWVQMQHAYAVSGADIGRWFGHNGKNHGVVIEVEADQEFIKQLVDKELKFWDDVQNKILPPLSDRDFLLLPETEPLLIDLREAKILSENAEIVFKKTRDRVLATYSHAKIAGAGVKIIRTQKTGTLDFLSIPEIADAVREKLTQLDPAYVDSFRKPDTISWPVTINKPKKERV